MRTLGCVCAVFGFPLQFVSDKTFPLAVAMPCHAMAWADFRMALLGGGVFLVRACVASRLRYSVCNRYCRFLYFYFTFLGNWERRG